jgi:hypothetical protein
MSRFMLNLANSRETTRWNEPSGIRHFDAGARAPNSPGVRLCADNPSSASRAMRAEIELDAANWRPDR